MKQIILIVFLFALIAPAQAQTSTRTMAVTFDDLPYVRMSDAAYLPSAQKATEKILSTLKKHKVPATGFVNERQLDYGNDRDARIALLRDWVKSGMMLGNHTYSHPDFNQLTVAQFEEEIVKGDVVTRQLMQSRRPYQLYFRHPMTHTGDTLENSDYIFNVGYAQALQKGDTALAKRIREAYLDLTIAATEFAEKISPQLFGREIPQLFLIHANDINADCLDELLRRLTDRGYKFVTLDKVMSDPAYETKDTYVNKYGPTWFFRWSKSKGMNLDFSGDADPPKWVMDLYNSR